MCRAAAALGVAGWVRNRADGSVEAMVQGDDKGLREIIAWARNGPPAARVVDVQVGEATGDFAAFECRPTA
jgi:acylphosphatase